MSLRIFGDVGLRRPGLEHARVGEGQKGEMTLSMEREVFFLIEDDIR